MENSPTPAIVRDACGKDTPLTYTQQKYENNDKIISQPKDTVTFTRGFGDTGYRVQVVEHECPNCGFERMIRRVDVNPEFGDEVRYWCLNPNCVHFVSDHLSHACHGSYPQRDTKEPAVFEEVEV